MTRALGRELLRALSTRTFAFAAFNVCNMETTQAVVRTAEQCGAPVFVQLSPGAIAYAGYRTLTRLVFDEAEQTATPVIVHLDHCRDPDLVLRAVDDGFGSVMFDGSTLPLQANIRLTERITRHAHAAGVAVEGEVGLVEGAESSSVDRARMTMTSPADARRFATETNVDILAPAIGNIHRMPRDTVSIDLAALERIAAAAARPIALHGGSGVVRSQVGEAIAAGVGKVNISSNVSRAMAEGIRSVWAERPGELDARRYLGAGRESVAAIVREYLELTRSCDRHDRTRRDDVAVDQEPE